MLPRWLAGQVHCPHCLAAVDRVVMYLVQGGSLLSSDSRLSAGGGALGARSGCCQVLGVELGPAPCGGDAMGV